MSERQAICIVVDGLRASALGTYGNTTSSTSRLDKLAGRSTVVEWLWADSPQLGDFYRGVWQGTHAARRSESVPALSVLGEAGLQRRLITDDSDLAEQPAPERFDKVVNVETAANFFADDISDTAMGQFCSAVLERLKDWRDLGAGGLTWVHTRGLFAAWDAPADVRAEQLDEDDPPPTDYLVPPDELRNVDDPDVLLVHRAAYAAQVAVVDACVGALCQAIDELAAGTETLLMLVGSRGFALGEHGAIGADCRELYGERLHLPWLLHVCGEKIPRPRVAGLAQPADVGATLLYWFGLTGREEASRSGLDAASERRSVLGPPRVRELAVSVGTAGERAVRTPAWFLREPGPGASAQLFTKPDDRWEANDVAVRCPQIVEQLHSVLDDFAKGAPVTLGQELINPSR